MITGHDGDDDDDDDDDADDAHADDHDDHLRLACYPRAAICSRSVPRSVEADLQAHRRFCNNVPRRSAPSFS